MDTIQCGTTPEDLKLLDGLPSQKGGEQAAEAEDVIEVPVRDQHARETLETRT